MSLIASELKNIADNSKNVNKFVKALTERALVAAKEGKYTTIIKVPGGLLETTLIDLEDELNVRCGFTTRRLIHRGNSFLQIKWL